MFPRLSPRALLHHPQTSGARAHLLRKWRAKKNGLLKPSLIPESVAAGCSALLSGKTGLIPRILGSLPHTSLMPTSSLPNSTICIPTNRAPVPSRSTPKDEATVRERVMLWTRVHPIAHVSTRNLDSLLLSIPCHEPATCHVPRSRVQPATRQGPPSCTQPHAAICSPTQPYLLSCSVHYASPHLAFPLLSFLFYSLSVAPPASQKKYK
ncbi:hypothetical protein DFJ77DRAFT_183746 [Powellomyces hirtus]|nr:hypothetical protein DFJ77DRAFT_183746 [Powellomyces hirtus]